MSAPQHFMAPPGWYPDPDGAPSMVRWWDGRTWSDVSTPAGPGVAVGTMPGLPPSAPPSAPPDPFETDDPDRTNRTPWVVGLTLLVVAVVVVTGVLVGSSGNSRAPTASTPTSTFLPPPEPPSFPPGTVRIVDEAAGISYPHLGNGWFEYDLSLKLETTSVQGQYFVTQDDPPSGGVYLAECTSGPIADGYGWTGPDSLTSTAHALAASQRANYYPEPNEQRVVRDEPITVDGHEAYVFEFQLSWDVPGYEATGERAAVLLVDVDRPMPAMLFLSIPNTHAELYGVIDRVINDVDVI